MKKYLFILNIFFLLIIVTACSTREGNPPTADPNTAPAIQDNGQYLDSAGSQEPENMSVPEENGIDNLPDIPEPAEETMKTPLLLPEAADYPNQASYEQALNDYFAALWGGKLTTEERNAAILAEYALYIGTETKLTVGEPLRADLPVDFPLIPSKEESEILGESADTYRNTLITTYYFGNLYLQIWDAQQPTSKEWLSFLEASAPNCQGLPVTTPRGLAVGDSLDTLLELYPDAQPVPLDGNYLVYEHWPSLSANLANCRGLFFWIEDSRVSKIQLTHGLDGAAVPLIPFEGV